MRCHKCGEIGEVLIRINEKGIKGVWECSPKCDSKFIDKESALLYALEITTKIEKKND